VEIVAVLHGQRDLERLLKIGVRNDACTKWLSACNEIDEHPRCGIG
jgi:hypothetical protein